MRRRRPHPALGALLLVVAVFGLTWAVATSIWQAPDEPTHFAYVETLGENGRLPDPTREGRPLASDLSLALGEANANSPIFVPFSHVEWSGEKAARIRRGLAGAPSGDGGENYTTATANPPLYYLWELPAYTAARTGVPSTRLYAMRAWNVLLLLVTAVAAWVFVGELVSRHALTRLTGAAVVALWPMTTFLETAVNPDGGAIAIWTVAFACMARIAARGLTLRRGLALGLATGSAALIKSTGLALVPGTALLLAWCAWRAWRQAGMPGRAAVVRAAAAGLALAAALPAIWFVYRRVDGVAGPSQFGQVSAAAGSGGGLNVHQLLSYLWQFYLPRLDSMTPIQHHIPVISDSPVLNTWLGMGTGVFGWVTIWFRPAVYWTVGWAIVAAVLLAVAALVRHRLGGGRLGQGRLVGLGVTTLSALVLLAGVHWTDYAVFVQGGGPFAQGRYILPGVLPLLAVVVAASTRLPRRHTAILPAVWVGALVVLQLACLGLVLGRWYGA